MNGATQTVDEFQNFVSPTKILSDRPSFLDLVSTIQNDVVEDDFVAPDSTSEDSSTQNLNQQQTNNTPNRPTGNQVDTIDSTSEEINDDETTQLPECEPKTQFTRQVVMRADDDVGDRYVCDVKKCFSSFKNKSSWYRHRNTYHGESKKNKKKTVKYHQTIHL